MSRSILRKTVAVTLSGAVAVGVALAPNLAAAAVAPPLENSAPVSTAAAAEPSARAIGPVPRKATKSKKVPATLFGMNSSGQNTGAKALRLWDAGVSWRQLQPTNGPVNWAPLDAIVDRARANGYRDLLYVFGSTPAWAASRTSPKEVYGPGSSSYPANDAYYLDYARQVAQRYKGRINSYQIWNEADLPDFYSGSPEALGNLTAKTYKLIKSIDRSAKVAAAGLVPRPGRFANGTFEYRYLNTLRKHRWPTDAFVISMYPERQKTQLRLTYSNVARNALRKLKAPSKQLWESEANFATSNGQPFNNSAQMRLVARTYIDSMTYGFSRVYWYSWTQQWAPLGIRLTGPDRVTPTPAATAYSTVTNWMAGRSWQGCNTKGGVTRCGMKGGGNATIMFTNSGSRRVAAPKGTNAICGLSNSCTPLKAKKRFKVTSTPVLLKGARV